jgi:hypothetical protein
MDLSDPQKEVWNKIVDRDVAELKAGVSDSENLVLIDIGDGEVAYTAEEARHLAKSLKSVSDQRWDDADASDMVEYIRDLAKVVDNINTTDDVREKWSDREINRKL